MIDVIELYPRFANPEIIEKFWSLPGDPCCSYREYEILPDGYFDIVFILSDTRCRAFMAGPYTEREIVPMVNSSSELFSISFRLGCVPDLADVGSADLVDEMVTIDNLFGMHSDNLCEMLWKNRGITARQRLIEELIQKHEPKLRKLDRVYSRAVSIMEKSGGHVKINEIANNLGVSTRTLERSFADTLGMSPKKFNRLVRFTEVIRKLKTSGKNTPMTSIAHECGYFDQSHFIKDFRAFYGKCPLMFNK